MTETPKDETEGTGGPSALSGGLCLAEALHAAVCQAVALLNRAPEVARCAEGREARDILRQALVDYVDAYMEQPATDGERETIANKHRAHRKA